MSTRHIPSISSFLVAVLSPFLLLAAACSSGGAAPLEPKQTDGGMLTDGGRATGDMQDIDLGEPHAEPWQMVSGPNGGGIATITISLQNPERMWVGTYGNGVFRSVDGGLTWVASGTALRGFDVSTVRVDPKDDNKLFVVAGDGNPDHGAPLFRSLDGGQTWKQLSLPVPKGWESHHAVLPHPKTAGVVYLLSGDGVYRSSDNGDTFSPAKNGLSGDDALRYMAVDPTDDKILYVAGRKVFKSTDGGQTWLPRTSGLPADSGLFGTLVMDPRSPQTLYVSGNGRPTDKGLYKSTDGALTWRPMTFTARPGFNGRLYFDAKGNLYANYFATLWKSTDGGASFSEFNTGMTQPLSTFVGHPTDEKKLYLGWPCGLLRTSDGGGSYASSETGILSYSVSSLAFAPSDANVVYAGFDHGGVYKSTDGGKSFTPAAGSKNISEQHAVSALAVHPSDPRIVYAGTGTPRNFYVWPGMEGSKQRLYKSIDGGATFYLLDLGPTGSEEDITQITIDAKDPKNVLVAGRTLHLSTNEGVSFTPLKTPYMPLMQIVADPSDAKRIFASPSNIWYVSVDRGAMWVDWKSDMKTSDGQPFQWRITNLAIDPFAPATYYACHPEGFFKSEDTGATWSRATVGMMDDEFCRGVFVSPARPKVLFALSATRQLHRSSDGATTWQTAGRGLPAWPQINAFALSPGHPDVALIAPLHGGIYRTQTGGR